LKREVEDHGTSTSAPATDRRGRCGRFSVPVAVLLLDASTCRAGNNLFQVLSAGSLVGLARTCCATTTRGRERLGTSQQHSSPTRRRRRGSYRAAHILDLRRSFNFRDLPEGRRPCTGSRRVVTSKGEEEHRHAPPWSRRADSSGPAPEPRRRVKRVRRHRPGPGGLRGLSRGGVPTRPTSKNGDEGARGGGTYRDESRFAVISTGRLVSRGLGIFSAALGSVWAQLTDQGLV